MRVPRSKAIGKASDGILPLEEHLFRRSEINTCCRTPPPADADSLPADLTSYLAHSRPNLGIHEALTLSADLPLDKLVRFVLRECHRPLGARLSNLMTLMETVDDSHRSEDDVPEIMRRLRAGLDDLRAEVIRHLLREEDVLFPWLVSGNGESAITVINEVKAQHKIIAVKAKTLMAQAGWLLDRRETCMGQVALHTALTDFSTAIAIHINVENHVLYPRALQSLA